MKKNIYQDWREPIDGEELHKFWLNNIERALEFRKNCDFGDKIWEKMYDMFRGSHWGLTSNNIVGYDSEYPREEITVNRSMGVVLDTLAFLLQSSPKFSGVSRTSEDVISCKVQAEWLNTLWQDLELDIPIYKACLDWLITGIGIVKTGFSFSKDYEVRSSKDGDIIFNDYIRKEKPFCYRVNPFFFLWDYKNANDLESSRWCCEIFFIDNQELFANKNYDKKAINAIKEGSYSPTNINFYLNDNINIFNTKNDLSDNNINNSFVAYELWDKKYKKHRIYLSGVPVPLIDEAWPYEHLLEDGEGFPYEVITHTDIPNQALPQGLLERIADQQFELNRTRTNDFNHRRRFAKRKLAVVNDGSITPEQLKKFLNTEDDDIILVNNKGDIDVIPDASIPQDQNIVEQKIINDINQLTGNDQLVAGGRLPSRTSATEINARAGIQSTKLQLSEQKINKFHKNIGYKILSHSRAYISVEQAVKILGSEGQGWQLFTASDLSSRVVLELEYTSSRPYNSDIDKQQRMSIFQMILQSLPILQQAQMQINIAELFKWVLEPYDFKDISRFLPENSIIKNTLPSQYPFLQNNANFNSNNLPKIENTSNSSNNQNFVSGASGQVNSDLLGQLMGGNNNK